MQAGIDGEQADKLAALTRTKRIAAFALVVCVIVFLVAKSFERQYAWLGFVAAFAEAATIGGLADWYAVVALFRRPLGLPIPHTAIIPVNKDRIADNLGRFIETNFLARGPVRERLGEVDFAALVADWLSDRERAAALSLFVSRLVPQTLAAVEQGGLRGFVADRMLDQLRKIDAAPLASGLLGAFTADGRHQQLLDQFTKVLGKFLSDEAALAAIRERIREELPSLFRLFRADAYLLKKIVASTTTLMDELRGDPNHPLRREFDQFVKRFVERLRTSKAYRQRAEALKQDFLQRPELRGLADDIWKSMRTFIEADSQADESVIREYLASMFVEVGRHLASDPVIRADMNGGFVVALASFVEGQKSGVSRFISDQVKAWDLGQLVRLIELNIGRDLQYIRFNGMIVGGIAGLVLHTVEVLALVD